MMIPYSLTYTEAIPEKSKGTLPGDNFPDEIRHAAERLILEAFNRGLENDSLLLSLTVNFTHLEAIKYE